MEVHEMEAVEEMMMEMTMEVVWLVDHQDHWRLVSVLYLHPSLECHHQLVGGYLAETTM